MLQVDLTGKRALVTGANSGIGAAVAKVLAKAGADVAINYIVHPEAARDVADAIAAEGRKALTLEADISKPDQVAAMFATLDREWGGIDILVNNAGIDGHAAPTWELDPEEWRRVLEINLFGTFYAAQEAVKRMVPQKSGVVINMSSVHERIPWSGYAAYASSKAGISMFTKTLAQETAPHGVRVVAVAPGAIKTPINKSVWGDPEGLADLETKIPMGRMGTRDEIAEMVAGLCSDLASYVTGTTVFVDGGMIDYASFAHGG